MDQDYELLDGSKCKHCVHRISIMMEPFSFDDFDLDDEVIDQIKEEYGEEIFEEDNILEQHYCSVMSLELEGRVKKCNKFIRIGSNCSTITLNDRVL